VTEFSSAYVRVTQLVVLIFYSNLAWAASSGTIVNLSFSEELTRLKQANNRQRNGFSPGIDYS